MNHLLTSSRSTGQSAMALRTSQIIFKCRGCGVRKEQADWKVGLCGINWDGGAVDTTVRTNGRGRTPNAKQLDQLGMMTDPKLELAKQTVGQYVACLG